MAGFGIVTLASLFPVAAVLAVAIFSDCRRSAPVAAADLPWYRETPLAAN